MPNHHALPSLLRIAFCTGLIGASASVSFAQAADNCADAPNLTASGAYDFDLFGATNESNVRSDCAGTADAPDLWYRFTAPQNGALTVDTCGVAFDSVLSFLDGCGGNVVACNDDSLDIPCGVTASRIRNFLMNAGQVVYIRITQQPFGSAGAGFLNVLFEPASPPPNDACDGATEIGPGATGFTTLFAADDGPQASCGGGTDRNDVFFSYTPSVNLDRVIIDTCNSTFDTVLSAFVGSCGSLGEVTCNDDYCGSGSRVVLVGVRGGQTYLFRVAGRNGERGTGYINVSEIEDIPAGNICQTASPASVGPNAYDTTNLIGLDPNCVNLVTPTQWFAYTATITGTALIDNCGDTQATVLSASDSCSNVPLVCGDATCGLPSGTARIYLPITAGHTYYIAIGAEFGIDATISGTFNIAEFPPPPNDNCADATPITEGDTPFDLAIASTDGPPSSAALHLYNLPDINDVWFRFTAPRAGILAATTCGSQYKVVSIYGSCDGSELTSGGYTGLLSPCPDNPTGNARLPVTAGQQVLIRVAAADFFRLGIGSGVLHVEIQVPLTPCIAIPADAVPEGELCGSDTNGGCGHPEAPPFFVLPSGPITIAGTTWADGDAQDSDWYRLEAVAQSTRIDVRLQADLPAFMFLASFPTGDCSGGFSVVAAANAPNRCVDVATISAIVPPGVYSILVFPMGLADFPCGTVNNYVLAVDSQPVGACCAPIGCSVVTEGECAAAGGRYQGDGSNCGQYVVTDSDSVLEDISGTGLAGPSGDDSAALADLGFAFRYFANNYTQVSICTNGFLQFDGDSTNAFNIQIPNPFAPLNAIFGLWDDLSTLQGGNIYYQTLGDAPNRRFIAQWAYVGTLGQGDGPVNFEIVLFETTNRIEFRYADIASSSFSAGIQNADGSAGLQISSDSIGSGNVTRVISFEAICIGCPADYNGDGALNADDLGDFITGYFNVPSDPATDFNADGVINADDLGDFITAYFNGCP